MRSFFLKQFLLDACSDVVNDNRIQVAQEEFITLIIKQLPLIANNAKTVTRFLISTKKFYMFHVFLFG